MEDVGSANACEASDMLVGLDLGTLVMPLTPLGMAHVLEPDQPVRLY